MMILSVLKVIGIVIGIVLLFFIMGCVLILFVPIRYRANISGNLKKMETVKAEIIVKWLLGVVSGRGCYENKKFSWKFRILWKQFPAKAPIPKKRKRKKKKVKEQKRKEQTQKIASKEVEEKLVLEEEIKREPEKANELSNNIEIIKEPINESIKEPVKKEIIWEKWKEKYQKLKYTFEKLCDNIKLMWKKKEILQEFLTHKTHKAAFEKLKIEALRLGKHLIPKRLEINAEIGFEDPMVTGQVLAVASVLYALFEGHININPDFENETLEGKAFVKGKMRVIHFLILIWNLYRTAEVRTTYKDIMEMKKSL